jgi:hypothetical protein
VIESPSQGGGNAPPDELTLNFTYDSGNSHWDCDVTRKDGTSYHVDSVVTDGEDVNHVIPGVTLSVNDLNELQTYQAKVYIGWNPGIIVAGNMSANKRLWVKNVGDSDGYDARIRILPDGDFTNVVGTPVRAISETKYLQTTPIGTFNVKVKADTSKVDVSYEGNPAVEMEIVADGTTENEIATGLLVVFNTGPAEDDETNIYISDGKSRVQIAADNSGAPGTFGTSGVRQHGRGRYRELLGANRNAGERFSVGEPPSRESAGEDNDDLGRYSGSRGRLEAGDTAGRRPALRPAIQRAIGFDSISLWEQDHV